MVTNLNFTTKNVAQQFIKVILMINYPFSFAITNIPWIFTEITPDDHEPLHCVEITIFINGF